MYNWEHAPPHNYICIAMLPLAFTDVTDVEGSVKCWPGMADVLAWLSRT